ncbi:endonuclease/exonuclease/phosphatase family protein [Pinibacter aurantiacus]|uniref:Endonuclease/exonuclease/phosphatase family protein n=1 Tax=Pinibacter aurantiacus TaxID=2851599 RepID=A0A9E2W532_9BACT|nr:endonuclease/exonuclease/phosphatase family protein [Pinibacter aurantiacus]MBV4358218.1 endonuclease/exonuclease/phosphatase family protein [Pinibacter aurantiacus]
MKQKIVVAILLFLATHVHAQNQLTVGTYNLRYQHNEVDTLDNWKYRSPIVFSLIEFYDFDIVGLQEGFKTQLNDIVNAMPNYQFYGTGREDWKDKGECSAILFKKDKFSLIDTGSFWLSETPQTPSFGWDAACTRVCSWVKLKDKKSKKIFYFFNTHFDHVGKEARVKSSTLITKKIKEIAGTNPVVLTGDFNAGQTSDCYLNMAQCGWLFDAYKLSKMPFAFNGSFNGFGTTVKKKEIIDHIFLSAAFTVDKYGILSDTYYGRYPSDHFPILVKIKY